MNEHILAVGRYRHISISIMGDNIMNEITMNEITFSVFQASTI